MKKIILLIVFIICLTGCGKKEITIEGVWENGQYAYTFEKDGICSYNTGDTVINCKYVVDTEKLFIFFDGNTAPFETTYRIEGKTLHIVDTFGTDVEYKKK